MQRAQFLLPAKGVSQAIPRTRTTVKISLQQERGPSRLVTSV
jgi:hypothetical protein